MKISLLNLILQAIFITLLSTNEWMVLFNQVYYSFFNWNFQLKCVQMHTRIVLNSIKFLIRSKTFFDNRWIKRRKTSNWKFKTSKMKKSQTKKPLLLYKMVPTFITGNSVDVIPIFYTWYAPIIKHVNIVWYRNRFDLQSINLNSQR